MPHRTRSRAAFPVGLAEFFCKAYSDEGDVICDPFAGSGSTLIAAERCKRIALAIEISPAYCDVICQRFADFTGQSPINMASGVRFAAQEDRRH